MEIKTMVIGVLSMIGLLISLYAFIVKKRMDADKNYKPLCDINDKVSCTKVVGSEYGSMFLVPNSAYGIVFYALLMALSIRGFVQWVFWLAAVSVIGSVYLTYVSFYKLRILCPLCVGIYLVNIGMFALSWNF